MFEGSKTNVWDHRGGDLSLERDAAIADKLVPRTWSSIVINRGDSRQSSQPSIVRLEPSLSVD